jgi:hypothetical protein
MDQIRKKPARYQCRLDAFWYQQRCILEADESLVALPLPRRVPRRIMYWNEEPFVKPTATKAGTSNRLVREVITSSCSTNCDNNCFTRFAIVLPVLFVAAFMKEFA